ncbi:hypothetical protein ACE3MZ_13950 [Paenibacillus sp. WLX1005]|uniref:hypothetical protein n=1 Tax=Paenibacillus sp. WLX1005 TaxID=3243766 RepID=UPI003983EDED
MRILQQRFVSLLLITMLVSTGCSASHTQSGGDDSFTPLHAKEEEPVSATDSSSLPSSPLPPSQQLQPLQPNELPSLVVHAGEMDIPVAQSSYCWGDLGCRDYTSDPKMLDDQTLPTLSSGAAIALVFPYDPAPNQIQVTSLGTSASVDSVIALRDWTFDAPLKRGTYFYTFQAYWTSEDGMYTQGDTSFVFGFQIE